jgi:vacuolar-type H+-ATPase subunit E/Vma4
MLGLTPQEILSFYEILVENKECLCKYFKSDGCVSWKKAKKLAKKMECDKCFRKIVKQSEHLFKKNNICKYEKLFKKMHCEKWSIYEILENKCIKKWVNEISEILKQNLISKTRIFFDEMKQDPEFLSLDQNFIDNPNKENYDNFVVYFNKKHKELNDQFDITCTGNIVNLLSMDDNGNPVYNSLNKSGNTFENFTNGNIIFPSRDSYANSIKSLKVPGVHVVEGCKDTVISEKVGASMSASQWAEISVGIFFAVVGLGMFIGAALSGAALLLAMTPFIAIVTAVGVFLILLGLGYI